MFLCPNVWRKKWSVDAVLFCVIFLDCKKKMVYVFTPIKIFIAELTLLIMGTFMQLIKLINGK